MIENIKNWISQEHDLLHELKKKILHYGHLPKKMGKTVDTQVVKTP